MKYLTAELYQQLNATDIDAADRADDAWDRAQRQYEARLAQVRNELPPTVQDLADRLCLHDAELVNVGWGPEGLFLWARNGETFIQLSYHLLAKPTSVGPRKHRVFSGRRVRWLYDEVDMRQPGKFSHDILFSDGSELHIDFDTVEVAAFETVAKSSNRVNGSPASPTQGPGTKKRKPHSSSKSRGGEAESRSAGAGASSRFTGILKHASFHPVGLQAGSLTYWTVGTTKGTSRGVTGKAKSRTKKS